MSPECEHGPDTNICPICIEIRRREALEETPRSRVEEPGHFYGSEPTCALCGHNGPTDEPADCIPAEQVGHDVWALRYRLRLAETRTQGLLEDNTRYFEDARVARRELEACKLTVKLTEAALLEAREVIDFYGEPENYNSQGVFFAEGGDVDCGATAREANARILKAPR